MAAMVGELTRTGKRAGHTCATAHPPLEGESHMALSGVLHRRAIWILRTTPNPKGESHGQIQEGFPTVARSARGQRKPRVAGDFVHRAGGGVVRGRWPLGHGAVWPLQGTGAARHPAPGARDSK